MNQKKEDIPYLTEAALGNILNSSYSQVVTQFKVSDTRLRVDYLAVAQDGVKKFYEFDGFGHYCDPVVMDRDVRKINKLRLDFPKAEIFRIPYWVQPDGKMFGISKKIDFPHGFIESKVFPANFCYEGIMRFSSEMLQLPKIISESVLDNLNSKATRLGEQVVMPRGVRDLMAQHKLTFPMFSTIYGKELRDQEELDRFKNHEL